MKFADNSCEYTEAFNPHRYVYTGNCIISGEEVVVEIPAQDLFNYRQGKSQLIEFLSAGDAEFLISGCSSAAFDELFQES